MYTQQTAIPPAAMVVMGGDEALQDAEDVVHVHKAPDLFVFI
jgi:hypothetical protein